MAEGLLAGKVAVVTGAGRGIGREIALGMSAAGARVVVNDVGASLTGGAEEAAPADDVVAEITAQGGSAVVNRQSVAEWGTAQGIVGAALDAFGRVDIVVNNAGILRDGMVFKMPPEDFDAVVDVHLRGAFYVSRAAVEHFKAQGSGCYLHMTSAAGLGGQHRPSQLHGGQDGHSRACRGRWRRTSRSMESAPTASRPSPGPRMLEGGRLTDEQRRARDLRTATWKVESIAVLAVALASDASRDISGQIFGARGGEVFVYSQPRPVRSVHKDGGWNARGAAATPAQSSSPCSRPCRRWVRPGTRSTARRRLEAPLPGGPGQPAWSRAA